jgi:adenylate kinase
MLNIVLFGPPGAGKGTQSEKLIAKYQLVHLSTGDIFRANIKGETALGTLAKSYMDKGQLVPDAVTISMLEAEVNKNPNAKGFIFDGFPRTKAQAEALDTLLKAKKTSITLMLALEVQEDELRKRLLLRGQNSGRPDDQNPEVIQKRIDVYNNETFPVKDFYTAQGKYKGVHGIGEIDEIFNALCAVIDTKISAEPKVAKVAPKKAAPKPARPSGGKVVAKKKATKKVAVEKVVKKAKSKPAAKKVVKKTAAKKATKKVAPKKATKKVAKKIAPKKVVKKLAPKKGTKKVATKKATAKKVVKKAAPKPARPAGGKVVKSAKKGNSKKVVKKAAKKIVKKVVAKKSAKPTKKVVAKRARPSGGKVSKKKIAAKPARPAGGKATKKVIKKKKK